MAGIIEKKGKILGTGTPLICVPVTEETKEKIVEEIRILTEQKVDMIEWRMDWFSEVTDKKAVKSVLEEIRPYVENTLFLLTFRSKMQGGQLQMKPAEVLELNEAAAKTGVADFVDIEYFEYEKPKKAIQRMKDCVNKIADYIGRDKCIVDDHDFEKTPERGVLQMILEKMYHGGADIVKLAVMPQNRLDVLNLLSATESFVEEHHDTPAITMSMGKDGVISRLCGEVFGSCVTFGSHEKASAPGQMQMDDLKTVLEKIHKSIS